MRKIIVSNRLPFSVSNDESGRPVFNETAGGLVSGLSAYLDSIKGVSGISSDGKNYLWVGWPGATINENFREDVKKIAFEKYNALPVFLSDETMDDFYHGFCNKTIWPLFHYFPSFVKYDEDYWRRYKEVNEKFAEAVAAEIRADDFVWIHDYHLMLLPKILREKFQDTCHGATYSCPSMGFFLHIPFPSFEIFRILPDKCRKGILEGLLGADVIGFHTQEYTQYFLRCVLRLLGYEHNLGVISLPDRSVKADTFPMGIDYEKYHDGSQGGASSEKEEIKKNLSGQKVILSIDRLDYSKGIINRLKAYEVFLEKNPDFRGKTSLLMTIVPSRVGVEDYQQMKKNIDELVGRINGIYGDVGWTPIIYQYKYLPFSTLCALYSVADVCLVTPLRDGMNLVAKEYLASRPKNGTGVLVLSELAGASKELGEALIVNPYDINEIADALKKALEMPLDEQITRNEIMKKRLARYNVHRWAEDFINITSTFTSEQKEKFKTRFLSVSMWDEISKNFRTSSHRAVFLDYDGTLVPFAPYPYNAFPDGELLNLLERISSEPHTDVVIVSGRDKNTLMRWFGGLNIGLVAEHGVWIKNKNFNNNKNEWILSKPVSAEWKNGVLPLLERYSDRLPGSFIEEKDYSVSFHYRRADAELGAIRAKELTDDLIHLMANNAEVQVFQGNKVIELRSGGVNKGTAILSIIQQKSDGYDFVVAMGDDWTDEDMFKVLASSPTIYRSLLTIRVGLSEISTSAKYNLRDYKTARAFLQRVLAPSDK